MTSQYSHLYRTERMAANALAYPDVMTPPVKWMDRAFDQAERAASWSKDRYKTVGAVVLRDKRLHVGFNGFPEHICDHEELLLDRDVRRSLTIHAERNALKTAGDCRNCAIFVTAPTCHECAAAIVDSGIIAVFCLKALEGDFHLYGESFALARQTYGLAGVHYREFNAGGWRET